MTLDLNKPLIEIDGTETKELLNRLLANILKQSPQGDSCKYWDWCLTLWQKGAITIDNSDYEVIRGCVAQAQVWAMVRAQLLKEMAGQKEAQKGTS